MSYSVANVSDVLFESDTDIFCCTVMDESTCLQSKRTFSLMVWAQAELDWILRDVRLHCVNPNLCSQRHYMTRLSYQVPAAQSQITEGYRLDGCHLFGHKHI